MRGKRLFWQIYLTFLLIIIASMLGVWWQAFRSVRDFYREDTVRHLQAKALIIEDLIVSPDDQLNIEAARRVCLDIGRRIGTRITVILPSGEVVADSDENPSLMASHADRPEIASALKGEIGHSVRYSETLRRNMMYVGCPVIRNGSIRGVVRTAIPLGAMDEALRGIWVRGGLAALLIAVLAAGLSLLISRRMSRPLEQLQTGAERFAAGDLAFSLRPHGSREMMGLTESMNRMAEQLQERLRTMTQQKNERDAVFASMTEGVLAVDGEQRVLNVNAAAARLLDVDGAMIRGKSIQETVRNVALQRLVDDALKGEGIIEADITMGLAGEKFLQAHGTALRDDAGQRIGALIVLADVTRLRRLENVRRDFVGNVSHELKTPITSIKGFVETLQDGAAEDPVERKRFLDILARQVGRLDAILNDLLALSRLEHESESEGIEMSLCDLGEVLKQAMDVCEDRARKKKIPITLQCPAGLKAKINAPLFEQAVVNLLDNAVKYSEEGEPVEIEAGQEGGGIRVAVQDHGGGIEQKHLPRLFERFYRVDKGRSRQLGGTGLGLAIVKHIVLAHRGKVSVTSTLGHGSTFTISLPPG